MADPELSLHGLPLLFDHREQAAGFIHQFQPLCDLVLQATAIQATNSKDSTVGPALIGLPKPNYPAPPPLRLNELYWPTGAARWARGLFLASKTVADALPKGEAVTFKAVVGEQTLETDLFVLPPHPVSCVTDAETLWLIPVVDERYWWQLRNVGTIGKPDLTTWETLYASLAERLGIELTVDEIHADYLYPDPEEFTRRYDNAATLLDAVAHSVGQRIVRQFNGDYRAIGWNDSAGELESNLADRTPWQQIAGDPYDHEPIPETVTVAFPRLSCGVPDCTRRFYAITVGHEYDTESVAGATKTIHSTAWALFNHQGNLTNLAELEALADRIASDYYAGLERSYDYTFAGLKEWFFTAYDDHALITFGAETKLGPEASTHVYPVGGDEFQADTSLDTEYSRVYTTRIQSPPLNFGVDQMLQQGQTFRQPAGVLGFQLATTLVPGATATARPLEWTAAGYAADADCLVTLSDPFYRNFLLAGERCWARRNCDGGEWEVVGENGLRRTGLALATIQGGGTGNVLIYGGQPADFGTPNCTRVSTGVTAIACHLPGAATVNAQDVLFLQYHPDHFKWFIYGNKGGGTVAGNAAPPIAFGRLTAAVCPQDHATVWSPVKDVVLIDGTELDPSTVTARFRFGNRGEEDDRCILLRVVDPSDEESSMSSSSGMPCEVYINLDIAYELSPNISDAILSKVRLTAGDTGVYSGSGTTTNGGAFTVDLSIEDGVVSVTLEISSISLLGFASTPAWPATTATWTGAEFQFVYYSENVPILGDPTIGTMTRDYNHLEVDCEAELWECVFVEHKVISPYVRIYYDQQSKKLKGVKRKIAVMYCSDEFTEDIWQGTDQCPEE